MSGQGIDPAGEPAWAQVEIDADDAPAVEVEPVEGVDVEAPAAEPVDLEATTLDEAEAEADGREAEIARLQVELAAAMGITAESTVVTCPTCRMGFVDHSIQPSPKHRRCAVCSGHGTVTTGSLVEDNDLAACDECAGRGWVGHFDMPAPPAAPPPPLEPDWRAYLTPEQQAAAGYTPPPVAAPVA